MAGFSARERAALEALADTFVPRSRDVPGLGESATDLGTPARVEEAAHAVLSPEKRRDLRLALRIVEQPLANLALVGRPVRFSALPPARREEYLRSLADSRVAAKRRIFLGVRKLVGFLHYTDRRTWAGIGYAGPPASPDPPAPRISLPAWDGSAVDAVVVGSGAGGGVASAILARAGRRVLVLEAGPLRSGGDFTGDEAEGHEGLYEASGAWTNADESVTLLAGRAAGGGTTVNWMTSLEPPGWLRAEWEGRGVDGATGREFDEHLAAVQARAHVTLEESHLNGPNRVLAEGADRLGWQEGVDWRRIPRNALGCRERCGFCAFGCPWNAKQGTLATWLSDAARDGARFLLGARADRVLVERGRAVGVALADGRQIRAPLVLLAGGAVQTAALLLRSGIRSRGVGRLYLHPATSVVGLFDRPIEMWKGAMQTVAVERFSDLDGEHHGVLLEAVPAHPGLVASALPWRGGEPSKRDMGRLRRMAALLVLARDARPGRVRLDASGSPRVEYRVGPADGRRLVRGMQELARIERAAGAREIATPHVAGLRVGGEAIRDGEFENFLAAIAREGVRPHGIAVFSAHQMGTVPLGRDGEAPADGRTAGLFDVEGLHVVDGSAFPSPSGVNPMITIQTLAHRAATRIARSSS